MSVCGNRYGLGKYRAMKQTSADSATLNLYFLGNISGFEAKKCKYIYVEEMGTLLTVFAEPILQAGLEWFFQTTKLTDFR